MVFGASYRIGRLGRIAAYRMWRRRGRRQHARHQRAARRDAGADARTDPGTIAHTYTDPAADSRR